MLKVFKAAILAVMVLLPALLPLKIYGDDNSNDHIKKVKDQIKKINEQEKELQYGFGIIVNSNDIKTGYENYERSQAIKDGYEYSYPGFSDKQQEALTELDTWMQKSILATYVLRNMEYGIQFRLLWKYLISETDFVFTPTDYSDNSKINIAIAPMIGFRSPRFIMPYFMAGPNFTLAVNPEIYKSESNWHDKINATKNTLSFSPGLIVRTGVDTKFKRFSLGFYYQYKIKDFSEFNYWNSLYKEGEITGQEAFGNSLAQNSRFGISMSWYIHKNKK
jgi:hypothetical protein